MKIPSPNAPLRHPRAELPSHRPGIPFVRSLIWWGFGRWVCRLSFHNWYALRCMILRLCGAKLHPSVKIRASARIDRPWNLTMGKLSAVGDKAILNCRSRVYVGDFCTISQHSKVFTLAEDPLDPLRRIYTAPVRIEKDAWVAADVMILPGVTIGEGVVVGARGMVDRNLPPWTICTGEPAKPRRQRPMLDRTERDEGPRWKGAL
ncbi:MAG: colanic acid biosynthesis acetyltransferase WcaF [Planctomycetota bacterium]|nr:MAG: colanic acid biosynthesis acetyltransferase WcaF [Planctomycetota bacterium]